jgi:citrate/tricarballylate utilization protein
MPVAEVDSETRREARRQIEICNACRYCEGFCAVFPAIARRRQFSGSDLHYLANLCHGCKGCYHACQYAPPHPFAVNVPKVLAELRTESYQAYAWPTWLARAFRHSGLVLAMVTTLLVILTVLLTATLNAPGNLMGMHVGAGAFYAVIPWGVMSTLAAGTILYALFALAVAGVRYWRDTAGGSIVSTGPVGRAATDIATLRYLGGGHGGVDGCNDIDESFSQARRWLHHALFYGFLLCCASTAVATIYAHFLGLPAPYPVVSLPVLLGLVGGIGLAVGAGGLLWVKMLTDPVPEAKTVLGGEYALLALLLGIALTGVALLGLRQTPAMGILLAVHLGTVLSLFLLLPYSKMVHGLYRGLALLLNAIETRDERRKSGAGQRS